MALKTNPIPRPRAYDNVAYTSCCGDGPRTDENGWALDQRSPV